MKKNAVLNALSLALCVLSFTFPVAADEPAAQSGSLRKPLEVASETEETTDWLRIHSSSTSPLVMFRTTTSSGAPDNAMLGVALNANDGVIGAAVNDMFIAACTAFSASQGRAEWAGSPMKTTSALMTPWHPASTVRSVGSSTTAAEEARNQEASSRTGFS